MRNHWIAGILMADWDADGHRTISIDIYDSAPSAALHRELRHGLRRAWPELVIRVQRSIRQVRNSNACGIFMSAVFFSVYLDILIHGTLDLPKRLRPLLHMGATRHPPMPREEFLRLMAEELLRQPSPAHDTAAVAEGCVKVVHGDAEAGSGTTPRASAERFLEGGQAAPHKKTKTATTHPTPRAVGNAKPTTVAKTAAARRVPRRVSNDKLPAKQKRGSSNKTLTTTASKIAARVVAQQTRIATKPKATAKPLPQPMPPTTITAEAATPSPSTTRKRTRCAAHNDDDGSQKTAKLSLRTSGANTQGTSSPKLKSRCLEDTTPEDDDAPMQNVNAPPTAPPPPTTTNTRGDQRSKRTRAPPSTATEQHVRTENAPPTSTSQPKQKAQRKEVDDGTTQQQASTANETPQQHVRSRPAGRGRQTTRPSRNTTTKPRTSTSRKKDNGNETQHPLILIPMDTIQVLGMDDAQPFHPDPSDTSRRSGRPANARTAAEKDDEVHTVSDARMQLRSATPHSEHDEEDTSPVCDALPSSADDDEERRGPRSRASSSPPSRIIKAEQPTVPLSPRPHTRATAPSTTQRAAAPSVLVRPATAQRRGRQASRTPTGTRGSPTVRHTRFDQPTPMVVVDDGDDALAHTMVDDEETPAHDTIGDATSNTPHEHHRHREEEAATPDDLEPTELQPASRDPFLDSSLVDADDVTYDESQRNKEEEIVPAPASAPRATRSRRSSAASLPTHVSSAPPRALATVAAPQRATTEHTNDSLVVAAYEGKLSVVEKNILTVVEETWRHHEDVMRSSLCFFQVATALARVGDGIYRGLNLPALQVLSRQRGYKINEQYDVGDALTSLGKPLALFCSGREGSQPTFYGHIPPVTARQKNHVDIYVQCSHAGMLPVEIEDYVFLLGARFHGSVGPSGAHEGHYTVTRAHRESIYGVYLPKSQHDFAGLPRRPPHMPKSAVPRVDALGHDRSKTGTAYRLPPKGGVRRWQKPDGDGAVSQKHSTNLADGSEEDEEEDGEASPSITNHTRARGRSSTAKKKRGSGSQNYEIRPGEHWADTEEMRMVRGSAPTYHLNMTGEWMEKAARDGLPIRPELWKIHSNNPPHVIKAAWVCVKEATRRLHIRCLRYIQNMPHDLQKVPLPQAIMEMLRRLHHGKLWTWSTLNKMMSATAAALQALPMYSTETKKIFLRECPEWVAMYKTVERFQREMPTAPPDPVTYEEVETAKKHLRTHSNPRAALYLAMLWSLAARAGDLDTLLTRDVVIKEPRMKDGSSGNSPLCALTVTMRHGKGARHRGPYPVMAVISRDDATALQKELSRRHPRQPVFLNPEDIREAVRAALRMENPDTAMPSIRKGAVIHLAAQGVREPTLMRITGHKRVETLRIYLGHGRQATREDETVRVNAELLHRPLEPPGPERRKRSN